MDMGSGHGWAMAHGVLWNCNVQTDRNSPDAIANSPSKARSVIYCEKPPTAQNYAIGCYTHQASDVRAYKYAVGYVEGANVYGLKPESLYEAQYAERHNDINLKIISQPVGVQSCTGSFIQLSVSVEAADMNSVTYQWFKDGNEIVGQTARQLTLSAATIDDAGVYYVRVSCFGKTINSEQATVALIRSLPDEMQLSGFPSSFDKNTTLHILVGDPVTGTYPDVIAYQWSYSGTGVTFTSRTANPVEMLVGAAPTNGTISVLVFHPCGVKTVSRNITFGPVNNLNPALINVFFQNNFLYVGNIRSARSLSVIDLNGREMYYASLTNKIEFSALLNNFRSGIYIVSIISSDGSNIRKILVKH
ncbi:MAG: T9SS type A sorting domain-containing protein, partial [Tannerella sp.]|jgi:hypothetical protein|nr:T9SS type A sorting domain-containing protein [Tannerella sp.]